VLAEGGGLAVDMKDRKADLADGSPLRRMPYDEG
jgi:hypothetical protein